MAGVMDKDGSHPSSVDAGELEVRGGLFRGSDESGISSRELTSVNASDDAWVPCDESQDHDVGNVTPHFERDKLLGREIQCSTFLDELSNAKGTSISISLESSTSDYVEEKMQFISQVAADSCVPLNQADYCHKLESTSDIMSELCETEERAQVKNLSCHVSDGSTTRENISDEVSILMNPKSFPIHIDRELESTKLVSETKENNVHEHADDFDDFLRMSDNNKVEGNNNEINCSSVMNLIEDIHLYCDGFCKMKVKYVCEDGHTLYNSVVGTGSLHDPSNLNTLPQEDGRAIVKRESQWPTTSVFSTLAPESKDDAVCSLNTKIISFPPACQIGDQKSPQTQFTEVRASSQIETVGKNNRLEMSSIKCQDGISYKNSQNENVANTYISYSSEVVQKKNDDDDGTYKAILVGNDSEQAKMQLETEIKHGGSSSTFSSPHEESTLNVTDDDNCSYVSSISKASVITENSKACEVSEEAPSFSFFQPSVDQTGISLSNQQPDKTAKPAIVSTLMDILVDSNILSDKVKGQWGYISGAQASCVLPSIQTSDAVAHKDADESIGSFEAPSFMTLVNPSVRSDSCEIQQMEKPQHQSLGKMIKEESIAKVASWSPSRPYTPLRDLLIEANLGSRRKSGSVKHHQVSPRAMKVDGQNAKTRAMVTERNSCDHLSCRADQKEGNSPARDKRGKGRLLWFPFACCT